MKVFLTPSANLIRSVNTATTGLIKVRFELSKLVEHSREPTLVMRVLDILSPIKLVVPGYEGLVMEPEVGELVRRRATYRVPARPWSYPLNTRVCGPAWKPFLEISKITS